MVFRIDAASSSRRYALWSEPLLRHWFEQLPNAAPSVQARWATANAIQNGVGDGGLADDVLPSLDGQLAGDHGRAAAVSLSDDLHQISALRGREPVRPPVVEDQQLRFGDAAK